MSFRRLFLAAALSATAAAPAAASSFELGVLQCTIDGGTAYVVGSNKSLFCTFRPSRGGGSETYTGMISKLGVDIGITQQGSLQWAVLAATNSYEPGTLAGKYLGINAEASVVTGGGANLLVGGFKRSLTLQPLSTQAQTGVNLAVAATSIELYHSLK